MTRSADRLARLFGIDPDARQVNVEKLYLSTEKTPGAYWLQLFIATGIAHLGLTLNSTAVIIGAMLISPLMTPIVQVGMGFAIGHLHLTMRATMRLINSIVFVTIAAALLTQLLPISEATGEILGRTHPTFLDMIVALFCGLAASFTHARGSKDVVTSAAGTAIAIALVPPICVIGFGIGTGSSEITFGATLLFTANLAAIILVSDVFFLLTGFGRLDFERLEQRIYSEDDRKKRLYRIAQAIWSPTNRHMPLRLLLPLGFVLSVSVPLYRALSQVVAQVQAKEAITQALDRFAKDRQVLARRVEVTDTTTAAWVTLVGEPADQPALAASLNTDLEARLGRPVSVRVDVVPSGAALDRFLAGQPKTTTPAPAPTICPPAPDLAAVRADALASQSPNDQAQRLTTAIDDVLAWATPTLSDGRWLGWSLQMSRQERQLVLDMLGGTAPPAQTLTLIRELLRREIGLKLDAVRVRRITPVLLDAAADATLNTALLGEQLDQIAQRAGLAVQLQHPPLTDDAAKATLKALRGAVPTSLHPWMQVEAGARWTVRVAPPIGQVRMGSEAAPVRRAPAATP